MCNKVSNTLFKVAPTLLSCLLEGSKTEALLKQVQVLASHLMGCSKDYQAAQDRQFLKHGGTVCWLTLNMARSSPPTQESSNCAVRNSVCLKDSIRITRPGPCAVAWKKLASHFNKLQILKKNELFSYLSHIMHGMTS